MTLLLRMVQAKQCLSLVIADDEARAIVFDFSRWREAALRVIGHAGL